MSDLFKIPLNNSLTQNEKKKERTWNFFFSDYFQMKKLGVLSSFYANFMI